MLLRSVPGNRAHPLGNYAGPEGPDIRPRSPRVTPGSDVIHRAEAMTNAGAAMAAGVVSGARAWSPGWFKRRSGGVWPE
jgi:hypothetical protein